MSGARSSSKNGGSKGSADEHSGLFAAPEPVLRTIGEESQRKGTDKLTSRQIDQAIKAARAEKPKYG